MDLSKYAALFVTESREHLKACNSSLLQWEREPASVEPVDRLFRSIHTIKGMASTMGYAAVSQLSHRMENLLDRLRQRQLQAGPQIFQLLFRSLDALGKAVEAAAAGQEETADHTGLIAELDGAAAGQSRASAAPEPEPTPARRVGDAPRSRPIRVQIRPMAVMRGARAALVLRKAETLGSISGLRPPLAQFERDDFDGRFFFRLQSAATEEEITAVLNAVGDVESLSFEEPATPGADPNAASRQIRVDLRRLDLLMKQVGELVVAKNRLGSLAAESSDPFLVEVSERIGRLVSAMQGEVLASRMTP
ncbi:MAG TPA: Hpt domain-containing protein, partial [Gemmatimonadales bacterium]